MMKALICLLLLLPFTGISQDTTILDVLDDQVEAFNSRDVDRMLKNLSDDFVWYSIVGDSMSVEVSGKRDFKVSMKGYYKAFKDVHSEIVSYSISGNKVSFSEKVSFKKNGKTLSQTSIGVYEIVDGLIVRIWYFY